MPVIYKLSRRLGFCAAALVCCSLGSVKAQLGISPSQNQQFLEELRDRAGRGTGDALAEGDRDALGQGRGLSAPHFLSASLALSERLASDFTQYAGYYDAGHSYLNPWNGGLVAP